MLLALILILTFDLYKKWLKLCLGFADIDDFHEIWLKSFEKVIELNKLISISCSNSVILCSPFSF